VHRLARAAAGEEPGRILVDGRGVGGQGLEVVSFEQAVAVRESAAYQEALVALSDGVERDFRIVEGLG
ncbi:DUF1330 domain-containing protein, partial [Streptomyces sp. NPDC059122]|uniref:DUF1330 domain-containing protein n=1 Tax=Streptomyces sp. NPDC059122 TaxID=3346732 RepID=UPI0036A95F0D